MKTTITVSGDSHEVKRMTTVYFRKNGNATEEFSVEETPRTWEVYSSLFGDDKPATTYDKRDYSLEEAIEDYKKNGIY